MLLPKGCDVSVLDERVADRLVDGLSLVVGGRNDEARLAGLMSVKVLGRDAVVALRGLGNLDAARFCLRRSTIVSGIGRDNYYTLLR
jgi:hypothetical protein